MTAFVWTFPTVIDRVIDGDTVEAHVRFSPMEIHDSHGVNVRVEGINALELSEGYGREAKAYAETLLPPETPVILIARKRDKYGRLLARITLPDGRDFSTLMLTQAASDGVTPFAKPYAT